MAKSKEIGVLSLANLQAILLAFVGLIAGILYAVIGAIYDVLVSKGVLVSDFTPGVSKGTALAFFAIIGMPILFAIFGFIAGAIGAFLYNLVAGRVGGWDDKGNGPNDLTWTFWGISIVGGAIGGAIIGGIFGTLNDGLEGAFGGLLIGGFFGSVFFGTVMGIVWHHLR